MAASIVKNADATDRPNLWLSNVDRASVAVLKGAEYP